MYIISIHHYSDERRHCKHWYAFKNKLTRRYIHLMVGTCVKSTKVKAKISLTGHAQNYVHTLA